MADCSFKERRGAVCSVAYMYNHEDVQSTSVSVCHAESMGTVQCTLPGTFILVKKERSES